MEGLKGDPHMPLLAENRAIRGQLWADAPSEWRIWRCPPSPCLTSVLLEPDEETVGKSSGAPSIFDILDHLEHLWTAPLDPDRLRPAPLLDIWFVRRMDDACIPLFGEVFDYAEITTFTVPYLRLDWTGGWARAMGQYYRIDCCACYIAGEPGSELRSKDRIKSTNAY